MICFFALLMLFLFFLRYFRLLLMVLRRFATELLHGLLALGHMEDLRSKNVMDGPIKSNKRQTRDIFAKRSKILDVIRLYPFLTCKNQCVEMIFEAEFYMSKMDIIWWHLKNYHFYMSKIDIIWWHKFFWNFSQNLRCHQNWFLTCKNANFLDVIRLYPFLTCKNQPRKSSPRTDFCMSKMDIIWWHLKF